MTTTIHPISPTMPARSDGRIATLDGLRGLAILSVLILHFTPDVPLPNRLLTWMYKAIFAGWLGVDLFFVLSGFLITGILLDTRATPGFFRNFYARRMLRIFPLYYGVLVLVLVVMPLLRLVNWADFQTLWNRQLWVWFYGTNIAVYWYDWSTFRSNQVQLAHFWSLAVEEQFYMVWPFIVWRLQPKRLLWLCGALCGVAILLRFLAIRGIAPLSIPMLVARSRTDALLVGAALAVLHREGRWRSLLPLCRVLAAVVPLFLAVVMLREKGLWNGSNTMQIAGLTLASLMFGSWVLLALAAEPGTRLYRVLASPFLAFFAKYSYGLYVWHFLFFPLLLRHLSVDWAMGFTRSVVLASVVLVVLKIAISVAIALVSWHLLENPCLRLKRYFQYHAPAPTPPSPQVAQETAASR